MISQKIRNINKRLDLGAIQRHKGDPASILSWVQDLTTLSGPDFPTDMQHCAENVFIKSTILATHKL